MAKKVEDGRQKAEDRSRKTGGGSKWLRALPGLLAFALPCAAYLLFPSLRYDGESIQQALYAEWGFGSTSSVDFWNPSSVLGNFYALLLERLLLLFGLSGRAAFLLQQSNAVLGGLSCLIFYLLLRRLTRESLLSLLGSFLFFFSAAGWQIFTQARNYSVGLLFLLLALSLLLAGSRKIGSFILLGVLSALAYLGFTTHVLFVPAAAAAILCEKDKISLRLTRLLVFLGAFSATVFASFSLIYIHLRESLPVFLSWPSFFLHLSRAFARERLLLSPQGPSLLGRLSGNLEPLLTTFSSSLLRGGLGLLPFLLLLPVLFSLKKLRRSYPKALAAAALWLLLSFPAFLLIEPSHLMVGVSLLPLILLAILSLAEPNFHPGSGGRKLHLSNLLTRSNALLLGLVFLVVSLGNFSRVAIPESRLSNNPLLSAVLSLSAGTAPGDCIVALGLDLDAVYFRYFGQREVLDIGNTFQALRNSPQTDPYLFLTQAIDGLLPRCRVFLFTRGILDSSGRDFSAYSVGGILKKDRLVKILQGHYRFGSPVLYKPGYSLVPLTGAEPSKVP